MGSSLSVVRIKKNMIYMKVEDPPGANTKFSPKEFLCRHLKIVIALALISTAMSVTSLVIAVTHMHGEDGGNIDLGDMGFRTANENSSTKMHERQKRASNTLHSLYCPWGDRSLWIYESEIEQGKTLEEFDDYCQCSRKDMCKIDQYHRNHECRALQNLMEDNMKSKAACVIHDICYKTERSKEKCDEEFIHNFKKICRSSHEGRAISAALGGAAGAAAPVGIATAATIASCALPVVNLITCPIAAAVAIPAVTVAPAVTAAAGVAAGGAADCNTASLIIKLVFHGFNAGHINQNSHCALCEGSAETVKVDLSSTSFGSNHEAHGKYKLNTAGDANFGWRPVYKHEKNKAWLYFIPKNRRVMVAGYASPAGGEWFIGGREIGQTYGWLKAKDTTNGIPTQNWYYNDNREPVRITKWDENGDEIY